MVANDPTTSSPEPRGGAGATPLLLLPLRSVIASLGHLGSPWTRCPRLEQRGLAPHIDPLALQDKLTPTAITTRLLSRHGGAQRRRFRSASLPSGWAGRRQAARGESCATSSPDGDRPVGWRPPCPTPVPGSARSCPAKRDFGGRVGFCGTTPALRCSPPPGTPPSQFSPSPAQFHLAPGTPHALLALYPLF